MGPARRGARRRRRALYSPRLQLRWGHRFRFWRIGVPVCVAAGLAAVVSITARGATAVRADFSLQLETQPLAIVAPTGRGAWLTVSARLGGTRGQVLFVPRSGHRIARRIAVGAQPRALAAAAGTLWVANGSTRGTPFPLRSGGFITRVDANGSNVREPVAPDVVDVVAVGTSVWWAERHGTATTVRGVRERGAPPLAIATAAGSAEPRSLVVADDAQRAWLLTTIYPRTGSRSRVYVIDLRTGIARQLVQLSGVGLHMARAANSLVVTVQSERPPYGRVLVVGSANGRIRASLAFEGADEVSTRGNRAWVTSSRGLLATIVVRNRPRIVATRRLPFVPRGISVDERGAIWILDPLRYRVVFLAT